MLVSEEFARRSMWCPMVRIRWKNRVVALNRVNPGHGPRLFNALFRTFFPRLWWLYRGKSFKCWGSGCMMWRWEGGGSRRGYCGLSGAAIPMGFAG
jgi:hypothetical protein